MEPQTPEHADPELEALLRRARPQPDGPWVHATGERLFSDRRRRRLPTLRLGAALAGGLAATLTVLSLAGVGPLGGAGDQPVQAKDDCRSVTVTRVERVPSIATGPNGGLRVTYTRKPVTVTEQRCR